MRKLLTTLMAKLSLGLVAAAAVPALAAQAIDYSNNGATTAASGAAAAGLGIAALIIILIVIAIGIFFFVFWILMLKDALSRNWRNDNDKTLWLVILVVGFLVGLWWLAAIIYYFAVKKAAPAVRSNATRKR